MNLYFAPLEGITGYIYRNTHAEMFGGCDCYYAPFINPGEQEIMSKKGVRDIDPLKNQAVNLKIQILTNNADSFLRFAEAAADMGYDEININLGCPASTVVKKGRGAGFLCNPDAMDRFFDRIFSGSRIKISVKTRIGYISGDEMDDLMRVYNRYPLSLLIIHPRARADFYNGEPDMAVFEKAYNESKNRICYNGNLFSADTYRKITEDFPGLEDVMIGRGAIANPAIFREIRGGKPLEAPELIEFTKRLQENYYEVLKSEVFTLNKLKEVWVYMINNFPEDKKLAKAVKKARTLSYFNDAIESLIR